MPNHICFPLGKRVLEKGLLKPTGPLDIQHVYYMADPASEINKVSSQ